MSSSNSNESAKAGGVSAATVVQIVLIMLKIFDVKPVGNWSWFWVLTPLWGSIALVVIFFIFVFLIALIFNR